MMNKTLFTLLLILFSGLLIMKSGHTGSVTLDDLTYYTEEYPPHNYLKDGKLTGISVEILQLIWKKQGCKLSIKDIQVVTWPRGYHIALNKKNTVLFSMGYSKEREEIFHWVGPYYSPTYSLIGKKNKIIKIKSIEDAKKYKIGTIRNDMGHQVIIKEGIKEDELDLSYDIVSMLKKLHHDRIDLICYNEDTAILKMKEMNLNPDHYEYVYEISRFKSGFGFNKDTSRELVLKFQKTLDQLIANGTVQKILDKHNLLLK